MADRVEIYDVAVSFAGAQRGIVEPIVRACQKLGLKVFYDKDMAVDFWGRNLITGMRAVYGGAQARFVVPFLSREYLASAYPMDEFTAAMRRAIEIREDSYLLPIIVESVEVPENLLDPAIGYLRLEDYAIDQLAQVIHDRVGAARRRHQRPREVAGVVDQAFGVRLPSLPTTDFSPRGTLQAALETVGLRFNLEAEKLTRYGFQCLVRVSDTAVDVCVDQSGRPVCGLRLAFEEDFHSDRLLMAFQWPRIVGNSANGWVAAAWDRTVGAPALEFTDFTRNAATPELVTDEELFHRLWGKVIDHLNMVGGR